MLERKQQVICLVLIIIVGGAVGTWFCARNALSDAIRIASGPEGGEYYKFGEAVKKKLQAGSGRRVQNIQTAGTLENLALLQQGKVDFAFLQSIVFPSRNIAVVAPLYLEPVLVPARKESGIESVYDLANRRVCTGSGQSGTGKTAETLLEFYGLNVKKVPAFFTVDHKDCDAGIVVMGLRSPSLKKIGKTRAIRFLDLPYTQALTESEAYTAELSIPEAMFARNPSLPDQKLHTFAYTALLAVNSDKASADYINEVLGIIYQTDIRTKFPDLIPLKKAGEWSDLPLHPVAQEYYNPLGKMEAFANRMESCAAIKELFFAFLAISYFIWLRFHELRKRKDRDEMQRMKDELDTFLQETIALDQKQMASESPEELQKIITRITELKIHVLQELTNEKLQADQMFMIFLTQCHNVICKIQGKLLILRHNEKS